MLNKAEFECLRSISEKKSISSKDIADLKNKSLIIDELNITEKGLEELENHKVDNAIILAAGMSTRFVPVSYELPKGLISVKGEVLVERIIRQLQEVGIKEIIVVVGYMMSKFLYLRDKYGVKLVVNNEYAVKNTHSSIYVSKEYLKNTYICCSDNYYPENPFHQYEYKAFYCSVFLPGTSYVERAFTFDEDGLIYDTNKPSCDQWIMFGHAYYDRPFSKAFVPILESYYGREGVENMYWENVYAENLDKLPMYIKQCRDDEILEFDSMEDLKKFDPDFIKYNKVKVFENICKTLNCEISDIKDIEIIKKGLNNRSFKFTVCDQEYIYRHPGVNASGIIDRKKEKISLLNAKKTEVDSTFIHIDDKEGWKISRFVHVTEEFDFKNKKHIDMLSSSLKRLHDTKIKVGFNFDYLIESEKLIEYLKGVDISNYSMLTEIFSKIKKVDNWLKADKWQVSLCHNDVYEPNLLVCGDKLELIDWEFAGDTDIGYDVCKLFSLVNPKISDIDEYVYSYFGRNTTEKEKIHLFACASMIYFYWFVWGMYESKKQGQATSYIVNWYDKLNYYLEETLNKINE